MLASWQQTRRAEPKKGEAKYGPQVTQARPVLRWRTAPALFPSHVPGDAAGPPRVLRRQRACRSGWAPREASSVNDSLRSAEASVKKYFVTFYIYFYVHLSIYFHENVLYSHI